jgi:hypothetical protein
MYESGDVEWLAHRAGEILKMLRGSAIARHRGKGGRQHVLVMIEELSPKVGDIQPAGYFVARRVGGRRDGDARLGGDESCVQQRRVDLGLRLAAVHASADGATIERVKQVQGRVMPKNRYSPHAPPCGGLRTRHGAPFRCTQCAPNVHQDGLWRSAGRG